MTTDPLIHPHHTLTTPAGETVAIDTGMVPVIRELWRLGLTTTACCQDVGEATAAVREQRDAPLGYGGDAFIDYHHGWALLKLPTPDARRLVALLADTPHFSERVRHPWHPGSWRMNVPLESRGIADAALLHFPKQQLPELAETLQSQDTAPPLHDTWDTIGQLVDWLDAKSGVSPEVARLLRVLKISEEAGEVAEAVHGAIGSNPRKGNSHTWDDVQNELCDVIFTSMVALRTITPDAKKVFAERLDHVTERSLKG